MLSTSKKIIFTDRSDFLLDSYIKDVAKYKILSSEEINELVRKAQNGDLKARHRIINSNLRFVITIAKQFQNRGVPLMDLISSGNLGLCKSIDKYNPDKGVVFLSYATWWIKQCIYNSIYWHGKEIRLPITQQLLLIEIIDTTTKFIQKHHRDPSSIELSELTDIPIEQIAHLSQFFNQVKSVDEYVGGDEDNMTLSETIPDTNSTIDNEINKEYTSSIIKQMLNKLSIREHDILIMWFGIGMESVDPKIIANMFGVSKERIRQMKESALHKLKRRFKKQLSELI